MPRNDEPEKKKEEKPKIIEVPVEVSITNELMNEKLNIIMKNQELIFKAIEKIK